MRSAAAKLGLRLPFFPELISGRRGDPSEMACLRFPQSQEQCIGSSRMVFTFSTGLSDNNGYGIFVMEQNDEADMRCVGCETWSSRAFPK